MREALGLTPAESFADITSDPELQSALEQAYGDTSDIDLWVGALAEDHLRGASVGENPDGNHFRTVRIHFAMGTDFGTRTC